MTHETKEAAMTAQPAPTTTIRERLARTTVRDAMQLGLFRCAPGDCAAEVARIMAGRSVHAVVVVGVRRRDHRGERLAWGIVSDRDLLRGLPLGLEQLTAGDLAGTEIVTVSPHDTLEYATRLMADEETTHLVVASPETGRPVGMLSTLDLARVAAAP
jgi:CBS domain-containing protein